MLTLIDCSCIDRGMFVSENSCVTFCSIYILASVTQNNDVEVSVSLIPHVYLSPLILSMTF